MPIVASIIKSKRKQRNGATKVFEEHTDSSGKIHVHFYMAKPGTTDFNIPLNSRPEHLDAQLMQLEIATFLKNIEKGNDVLGVGYAETTSQARFDALYTWGKEKIAEGDYQAMQYLPNLLSQVTDTQLNNLVGPTVRAKVRLWEGKIVEITASTDELGVINGD